MLRLHIGWTICITYDSPSLSDIYVFVNIFFWWNNSLFCLWQWLSGPSVVWDIYNTSLSAWTFLTEQGCLTFCWEVLLDRRRAFCVPYVRLNYDIRCFAPSAVKKTQLFCPKGSLVAKAFEHLSVAGPFKAPSVWVGTVLKTMTWPFPVWQPIRCVDFCIDFFPKWWEKEVASSSQHNFVPFSAPLNFSLAYHGDD